MTKELAANPPYADASRVMSRRVAGIGPPEPVVARHAAPSLRLLLLEDHPRDAARLEQALAEGGLRFSLRRVDTIVALRHDLDDVVPDLVLVDYAWRAEDGVAAVRAVRELEPDLPVVVVTDPLEDEAAVAVVKAGANGYVRKDRLARLPGAVREAMAEGESTRRRHAIAEAHANLARHDALTGLPNRAAFCVALRGAFATARREGIGFAVLYFDLDHFSDINDRLGHAAGDRHLREVGQRLRLALRANDVVARLGGDEFAVLQTGVREAADAGMLAAKLRQRIAAAFAPDEAGPRVSASVGIALYHPRRDQAGLDQPGEEAPHLGHPAEVLAEADLALHRAKAEGRDRYCFATGELDAIVRERQALAEELQVALEIGQFEVLYQPQIREPDHRIVGMEALIRWQHPRHGRLLPSAFLPVAERSGAMRAIGGWMLDTICRQIAAWQAAGLPTVSVALNLSAAQFRAPAGFVGEIMDTLARHGVAPGVLELEIDEATMVELVREHEGDLTQLARLGPRLVFDGFGMGQFALTQIGEYGFARLKIARRQVADAAVGRAGAAILRTVIGLAGELGIEVAASGVETAAELAVVTASGCPVAQGYHICPPVPAAEVEQLLRAGRIEPGEMAIISHG